MASWNEKTKKEKEEEQREFRRLFEAVAGPSPAEWFGLEEEDDGEEGE